MQSGALKKHMDLSKFPIDHWLGSEHRTGEIGLLKSETSDNPNSEVICLVPKCYSVLLEEGTVENTAKGVNQSQKANFKHDTYRDVHNGTGKENHAPCSTIRSYLIFFGAHEVHKSVTELLHADLSSASEVTSSSLRLFNLISR